jgi:hypothetical protein
VVIVVTLPAFGCPVQAIVGAYGLDERTVASWRDRADKQCQRVHQAIVEQGQLDLIQGPRRRDPGESTQYGRLDGIVRRVGAYEIPALRRRGREQNF